MQIPFMPFKILALAPFRFNDHISWTQPPVSIDHTTLDDVMETLEVDHYFPIPTDLCPAGGLDMKFSHIKDFHPDRMVQKNPFLKHILEAKTYLDDPVTKNLSVQEKISGLQQWPNLPPIRIASEKKDVRSSSTDTIDSVLDMIALPGEDSDPSSPFPGESSQVDALLQETLSQVFNHLEFRMVESAWRGLKLLLQQGVGNSDVKLEIVPVALDTLEETLDNLTLNLIENLPSFILIDLPFDNSPFCTGVLEKVAGFAETLMVPVMLWMTPRFMQIDSWNDLNKLPFLPHYLDEPAFAKWRRLRSQPSVNWLSMTCNPFLVRYPYGDENQPRKFRFHEPLQPWIGPVWAMSSLVAQTFVKTGWPTRFTDWRHIKIADLALNTKAHPRPIPTEVSFSEDRIDQFRRAGIMPLATMSDKDIVFTPVETSIGEASFSYQLFLSRITQFILWCRDNFSKDLTGAELEEKLTQAFSKFWELSGHTGPEHLKISAAHPDGDNRVPLRIDLQPSRTILPSGENIQMEFSW